MKIASFTIWALRAFVGVLLMQGKPTEAQDPTDGSSYFGGDNNEAYLEWLEQSSYSKSSFLPSSQGDGAGVALHWSTDEQNIHIAVAAKATGWVGFGLAESGSMKGADVVMFTAETNTLVDSYVLDQLVKPFPDDCQSWTLNNSTIDGGFVVFEATRLLDTGDSQDRVILNDSNVLVPATRLIAAWGDTATPSFHGSNTARSSVRFFGTTSTAEEVEAFEMAMKAEAEGNFTIQAKDFVVPNEDTYYAYFCFSEADLLAMNVSIDEDLHTIGIEPVVASPYVHHFIVIGSIEPFDSTLDCEEMFPGYEIGYVWAPGDLPLNLPSNVGGPLGTSGFRSFQLEIHYNNPALDVGSFDSSGVRFYYTSNKREHDLGILSMGDPNVELYGEPVSPNGGLSQHIFDCSGNCTSNYAQAPVTVIREHLHMHATGVSIFNTQFRNGEELREGAVQFWDFYQQGNLAVVQEPFQIMPGDAFRTKCDFEANDGVVFGLASQEEMCIAFLYYFPRQESLQFCGPGFGEFLPGCEAEHTATADLPELSRSFGSAPSSCPEPGPESPTSAALEPGAWMGSFMRGLFVAVFVEIFLF